MKLTARTVAALKLPAGKSDAIYFDDALPRFGYRLRKGAGDKVLRSWVVQYRHASATRRMTLGPDGVLNAEAARRKAMQALGRVADGDDPQADKHDRRGKDKQTFKTTVADYLLIKKRDVRGRTFTEKTRYLTGPYFKPLHGLALDQITRADVATRLNRITAESSSTVAALARAQLSALFTWALTQGLTEANPVIGTETPKGGKPRDRLPSDSELASVWRACGDDDHGKCIKLLILSGCRRQEVGGMCWSEIDLETGMWTLPAARAKNKRAHKLPLMPMMSSIIESTPRMASRDTLFGQRGLKGYVAWSHGKRLLDQRLGDVEAAWTVHDIRRTVATRMADLGIAPHIVETILNHVGGHKSGPAGVYNLSNYPQQTRAALTIWHDHLDALITGG